MNRQVPIRMSGANGFSVVEILIVICTVGLLSVVGVFAYHAFMNDKTTTVDTSGFGACRRTGDIDFCVKPSIDTVTKGDDLTLNIALVNHSLTEYSTERGYSSSCNEPLVAVNGKDLSAVAEGACTADITPIRIGGGQTRQYEIAIDTTDELQPGKNRIELRWDDDQLKSKAVTVTRQ